MALTYEELFSAQEATKYLGMKKGEWHYLYSVVGAIKPIPIGTRAYEGGKKRHTTCLFTKRQLDELKKRLKAVGQQKDVKTVEPTQEEKEQIFSLADAAQYLGKNDFALRAHLYRHKDVPYKKIGNQRVLLLATVKALDDPYGLKADAAKVETHEQTA